MLEEWPVTMVPTSAKTGEGIGELIEAVVRCATLRASNLRSSKMVEAIVMEVKQKKGQPTTLDVILKNGRLRVGDDIALCGYNGTSWCCLTAFIFKSDFSATTHDLPQDQCWRRLSGCRHPLLDWKCESKRITMQTTMLSQRPQVCSPCISSVS